MKKLLLTILFTLVLSGGASAEKLNLNCKFITGTSKDYNTNIEETLNGYEDELIVIDLKKNEIIEGPHLIENQNFTDQQNEITWRNIIGQPEKNGLANQVELNRVNGNLQIMTVATSNMVNLVAFKNYKCKQTEDKLF